MSDWSVDGIQKVRIGDGRPMQLTRLVHYLEEADHTPGVRYFLEELGRQSAFTFGEAVHLIPEELRNTERIGRTAVLSSRHVFERRADIEDGLRQRAREAFSQSRQRSRRSRNFPNAAQIRPSTAPVRGGRSDEPAWARIHVHNVGQGDTIVLELPEDQLWLIDARLWRRSRREAFEGWMGKLFPGRNGFNRVIVSHLHYDHIHSIPWILQEYAVDELLVPDSLSHPTSSAARVLERADVSLVNAAGTETLQFGGLQIQLVRTADIPSAAAHVEASTDPNDHEIAVMLRIDRSASLLAGDIPGWICREMIPGSILAGAEGLQDRYYKVSHHGSQTGCDDQFFASYPASRATVSCGRNNRYDHPDSPPVPDNMPAQHQVTWRDGEQVYTYEVF